MGKVFLTDSAKADLNHIIDYPPECGASVDAVKGYLSTIKEAVLSLSSFPFRGSIPKARILKLQGYRFLVVENHLVFYKVSEDGSNVIVYRILHQKTNYRHLL